MPSRARLLVLVGQAATVLVTWPLWSPRASGPPTLPLFDGLPELPFGVALLLTLALVPLRPRLGAVLHAVVLALAVVADQTRLQPTTVSLAILLFATTHARALAPAHVAALWFWAGAHKLLSPAFGAGLDPAFAGFEIPIACAELGLGLAAILRLRLTTMAALVLHTGVAAVLVSQGRWALVPWNLVLAGAGLFLHLPRSRPLELALLAAPLGLYLGLTSPYLAHALYTGDTWQSVRCGDAGCEADPERAQTLAAFGVPLEPSPRALRAHFLATCRAGEQLYLTPPSYAAEVAGVPCAE